MITGMSLAVSSSLDPGDGLCNAALRTHQTTEPFVFDPLSQRQVVAVSFVLMLLAMMLFTFRVLRAAVLTQPPITKIEEMGGLMHWKPPLRLTTRFRRLHQANGRRHALSVTPDLHLHCLTNLILVEHSEQIV